MSNFNIKIDIAKISGAFRYTFKSPTGVEKTCWCLPVQDCDIYETERGGAYVSFQAYESANSQYGDTHGIKPRYSAERYRSMTPEQVRAVPFCGNMQPRADAQRVPQQQAQQFQQQAGGFDPVRWQQTQAQQPAQPDSDNDLPF